jgi:hypothetical protein
MISVKIAHRAMEVMVLYLAKSVKSGFALNAETARQVAPSVSQGTP